MLASQRFILGELLCQIEGLEETITHFDVQIETHYASFEGAVAYTNTVLGVARVMAVLIVSEMGATMRPFATAKRPRYFSFDCLRSDRNGERKIFNVKRC